MTPTPWKAIDGEGPNGNRNIWASVVSPNGIVIIPRMNRVDARHLVECVNRDANRSPLEAIPHPL